jgi:hypothetical protein
MQVLNDLPEITKKEFKLAFSVLFQENLLTVPIEIVI